MTSHGDLAATAGRGRSRARWGGGIAAVLAASLVGALVGVPFDSPPAQAAGQHERTAASRTQDPRPVDLAKRPEGLRSVPKEFRPEVRWWWPRIDVDKAELKRELVAIERAGFGGVEQVLMRDFEGWDDPLFRENTKYALQVATDLGLSFDVTLGPGWPMSAPSANDFDKRLSMQDLVYGSMDVLGPIPVSAPLPQPPDNGTRALELVALTAAQIDPSGSNPGGGAVALDPKSMRDITQTVSGDSFTWTPPSGTWRVFAFYMRATGQRPHASFKSTITSTLLGNVPADLQEDEQINEGNLVIDHFNADATRAALEDYDRILFGNDMDALWKRSNGMVFEDSIEIGHAGPGSSVALDFVVQEPFWTRGLKKQFIERRGYDVTRFLPALFPEYGLSDGGGPRLKADFRDTLQDLWIDNHMQPIAEWADKHGMDARQQAYGFNGFSYIRGATGTQHPDVETLGFGDPSIIGTEGSTPGPNYNPWGSAAGWAVMDKYRQVSSGAHLTGADIVGNEWGAALQGQYTMQPTDYVALANRAMSVGVSSQILHGFAYKFFDEPPFSPPWPGWCAWCEPGFAFAESWNQDWPQWPSWRRLNDYVGRAQAVLRQGRPRVDMTVLVNNDGDVEEFGVPLARRGYTYDLIDQQSAAELPLPRGRRLLPEGPAYKALIVAGRVALAGQTARRVVAFARRGLPVVLYGALPSKGTGYADATKEDQVVRKSTKSLLELPNVKHARTPAALTSALTKLRVRPDFRTARASGIVPVHRRTAAGDVWFLYNHSDQAVQTTASFAAKGTPYRLDLFSGEADRAGSYRRTSRGTVMPVRLDAGQTAAVIIRRAAPALHATKSSADQATISGGRLVLVDAEGGRVTTRLSNGREIVTHVPKAPAARTLTGPWKVDATLFSPEGRSTVGLTMERLTDWQEVPELMGESGRATYDLTYAVPRKWIALKHEVELDLGAVAGSAEVVVNGRPVKGLTSFSGPRPITGLLRAGKNKITVRVATTLLNKMVELARTGGPGYAQFNSKVPEEAGLLGPVRLVPLGRSSVPLR